MGIYSYSGLNHVCIEKGIYIPIMAIILGVYSTNGLNTGVYILMITIPRPQGCIFLQLPQSGVHILMMATTCGVYSYNGHNDHACE